MLKKISLATLLTGAVLMLPVSAIAQRHREGGHERSFSGRVERGEHFRGGGRIWDERHGRGFYGPRYSFGFSYGTPYYYAPPPVCNPAGYYDQWGNWVFYPGCYPQ